MRADECQKKPALLKMKTHVLANAYNSNQCLYLKAITTLHPAVHISISTIIKLINPYHFLVKCI